MKAMIFAAGLGTRLRPLTNDKPKALVELCGKPLLEWVLLKIKTVGIKSCVVNVHHFADQIIDFLSSHDNFGLNLEISDERDRLLETGGGLKFAKELLRGEAPILIHNSDIISDIPLKKLMQDHMDSDALATLAVSSRETSRYLRFDENEDLCAWENVKTGEIRNARIPVGSTERQAFSGVHIIEPGFLEMIEEEGKFSIIEVYLRLAKHHRIKAWAHDSKNWFDVGKPQNLGKAEAYVLQQNS